MTESISPLILASSSPYRKQLLQRLQLPFDCISPDIDETPHDHESADSLVGRLAQEKCQTIALQYPDSIVIGSDQVLALNQQILGKPGTKQAAVKQLQMMSQQHGVFHTALCVYNPNNQQYLSECVDTEVQFRELQSETIERYLDQEDALNCAGSFKSEALGICLTEKISSTDPTALIGLPLIQLSKLLRDCGVTLP